MQIRFSAAAKTELEDALTGMNFSSRGLDCASEMMCAKQRFR